MHRQGRGVVHAWLAGVSQGGISLFGVRNGGKGLLRQDDLDVRVRMAL